MPYYFISDQDGQLGPMDQEELREMPLETDTLVWRYGFAGWREAGTIEELAKFLPPRPDLVVARPEDELEEEELSEAPTFADLHYRVGVYLTALLLGLSFLFPGETNTDYGIVIFTTLAVFSWWSLQQFFFAKEDALTARLLWIVMAVYAGYLLSYLRYTGLPWDYQISETVWDIGWCRTFGRCSADTQLLAQRLGMYFEQFQAGYLLAALGLLAVAVRFWRISKDYGPLLSWLGWSLIISTPLWLFVHLMDRLLGADSLGGISSLFLLAPFGLLILFIHTMTAD